MRRTDRVFTRLPASYVVVRDVRLPGLPRHAENVIIGATGAFVVETRRYARDVVINGAEVTSAGRSLEHEVEHARGLAAATGARLGIDVQPIVVVCGSDVRTTGLFNTPMVRGVRFSAASRLRKALTTPPCVLTADAVGHLAARLPGSSASSRRGAS